MPLKLFGRPLSTPNIQRGLGDGLAPIHKQQTQHKDFSIPFPPDNSYISYSSSSPTFLPTIDVKNLRKGLFGDAKEEEEKVLNPIMDFSRYSTNHNAYKRDSKQLKDLPSLPISSFGSSNSPELYVRDDEDEDDDNSSIQPSPVVNTEERFVTTQSSTATTNPTATPTSKDSFIPHHRKPSHNNDYNSNSQLSSSSTLSGPLPSHFSATSSISSSSTVDNVENQSITSKKTDDSEENEDLNIARQYWAHASSLSYTSQNTDDTVQQKGSDTDSRSLQSGSSNSNYDYPTHFSRKPRKNAPNFRQSFIAENELEMLHDQEEDDDEPLFEVKNSAANRVKSMLPTIPTFYKPLGKGIENGIDYADNKKKENVDDGEDESLVPHQNGNLYDSPTIPYLENQNDSTLSFSKEQSKTEAQLISNSKLRSTSSASSNEKLSSSSSSSSTTNVLKKSLASPVKTFGKLRKRSSRTFSKKLIFNNQSSSPAVPQLDNDNFNNNSNNNININNNSSASLSSRSSISTPSGNSQRVATPDNNSAKQEASIIRPVGVMSTAAEEEEVEDEEDDTLLPLSPLPQPASPEASYSYRSQRSVSPVVSNMVMTKTQFDNYRKSMLDGGLTSPSNPEHESDSENEISKDEAADNDEAADDKFDDELNDKKRSIRMRLKQDAHLSIYRQKMTKVTGSQTALSSYNTPSNKLRMSQSFGNFENSALVDNEDDDEYDDVPLGILKAHGFPSTSVNNINNNKNRLKGMQSQPNMSKFNNDEIGPVPNVLYKSDSASSRSSPTRQEVRPDFDTSRKSMIAPPFNEGLVMNRGLIGEIVREEEAKNRRKSMGNMSALLMQNNRSTQMLPSSSSLYNNNVESGSSSIYNNDANANSTDQIQMQLQQMMQMQLQMLQHISGQNNSQQFLQQQQQQQMMMMQQQQPQQQQQPYQSNLKKHWSSFDVNQLQQSSGRINAPSIRSYSPSERSLNNRYNSIPTLKDLASQQPQQVRPPIKRVSTMQIVESANDDDDDEEDDAGWQELLEKRRGLKETWKQKPVAL